MPASPPEQLIEAIRLLVRGPIRLTSFRVSKKTGRVFTRTMPKRSNRAPNKLSAPVNELVWDKAIFAAAAVRPDLMATIGTFWAKARRAAVSKAGKSLMPSICKPMALMRGSSSIVLIISAISNCA